MLFKFAQFIPMTDRFSKQKQKNTKNNESLRKSERRTCVITL